jgi:hypothetical protein
MATILFDGTTTGIANGDSIEFSAAGVNPGQKQDPFLGLSGEFDGATVTLKWVTPDGDEEPTDTALDIWTAGKLQPLYLNSFSKYLLTISNAGGSTAIKAWAMGVNEV